MTKFLYYTKVAFAILIVAVLTLFAFTGYAKSSDCITTSQVEEDFQSYLNANPPAKDKAHYYRFTGTNAESIRYFVNKNYGAELEPFQGIILLYEDGQDNGLVGIYPDDTINSCHVGMLRPSTDSIKKVLEFLQGV